MRWVEQEACTETFDFKLFSIPQTTGLQNSIPPFRLRVESLLLPSTQIKEDNKRREYRRQADVFRH